MLVVILWCACSSITVTINSISKHFDKWLLSFCMFFLFFCFFTSVNVCVCVLMCCWLFSQIETVSFWLFLISLRSCIFLFSLCLCWMFFLFVRVFFSIWVHFRVYLSLRLILPKEIAYRVTTAYYLLLWPLLYKPIFMYVCDVLLLLIHYTS